MRKIIAALAATAATAAITAGCTSPSSPQENVPVTGVPVSAPWSQDFATRARTFLAAQPPYHRHHWHNGILLTSVLTSAGHWYGLVIETDGTIQGLGATSYNVDSYNISMLVTPGDEIEFDYHVAQFLSANGPNQINVLKHGAVSTKP